MEDYLNLASQGLPGMFNGGPIWQSDLNWWDETDDGGKDDDPKSQKAS